MAVYKLGIELDRFVLTRKNPKPGEIVGVEVNGTDLVSVLFAKPIDAEQASLQTGKYLNFNLGGSEDFESFTVGTPTPKTGFSEFMFLMEQVPDFDKTLLANLKTLSEGRVDASVVTNVEDLAELDGILSKGKPKAQKEEEAGGTITLDNIPAGAVVKYDVPVVVKGDIGKGAKVTIRNGGLLVEGNVEDDVSIDTEGGGGGVTNISVSNITGGRGSSVNISASSISVKNKRISITETVEPEFTSVEIKGNVGNSVSISTDDDVAIKGVTGDKLSIGANGSIQTGNIGNNADLDADDGIITGNVGTKCKLVAGDGIETGDVGDGSSLDAGDGIETGKVGAKCKLDAGDDIKTLDVGDGSSLNANGSIETGKVGAKCKLDASDDIETKDVGSGCVLDAGGGITSEFVADNSSLDAGDNIMISGQGEGVELDACGKVRVSGKSK